MGAFSSSYCYYCTAVCIHIWTIIAACGSAPVPSSSCMHPRGCSNLKHEPLVVASQAPNGWHIFVCVTPTTNKPSPNPTSPTLDIKEHWCVCSEMLTQKTVVRASVSCQLPGSFKQHHHTCTVPCLWPLCPFFLDFSPLESPPVLQQCCPLSPSPLRKEATCTYITHTHLFRDLKRVLHGGISSVRLYPSVRLPVLLQHV